MSVEEQVARLVKYGQIHLGLDEEDAIYVTNLLLRELDLNEPFYGEVNEEEIKKMDVPDELTSWFNSYFVNEKGMSERDAALRTCFLMGEISPRPSKVNETFYSLAKDDPKKATDYLYDLCIKNDYVQKTKVDRNILWDATYNDGPSLEISINLSKPEKNNKDIAKLLTAAPDVSYPKCLLCHENLGFRGNAKKDPRETIRFIPLNLGGEKWFMQYSPYGYYDEHTILFYEKHVPMEVSRRILSKLIDFVDQFPHYFMGSNADLPIVGGSILNHEHFQGGLHLMPVMLSEDREVYESKTFKGCKLAVKEFYDTVLCASGTDREEVSKLAGAVVDTWRHYSDVENEIISDDKDGNHNTTTLIVRKNEGVYYVFMILRNNRCSEEYPDGIFHAHPEYHAIKKEGIGLIEAMGRFILPARLKRQLVQLDDIVANNMDEKSYLEKYPDMGDFKHVIEELKITHMPSKEYVNKVCQGILRNVGVFKQTEIGVNGLHKFIKEINL